MAPLFCCALHKRPPDLIFQQNERKGEIIMTVQKKNRGAFGRAFAVVSAAIAVSAAVENHRRPKSRDLNTLGIDPNAFDKLG
jgi:hypothetical protein